MKLAGQGAGWGVQAGDRTPSEPGSGDSVSQGQAQSRGAPWGSGAGSGLGCWPLSLRAVLPAHGTCVPASVGFRIWRNFLCMISKIQEFCIQLPDLPGLVSL